MISASLIHHAQVTRTLKAALCMFIMSLASTARAEPAADSPHASANPHGSAANPFGAVNDEAEPAPSLPQGTLEMLIVDPAGKPLPNVQITLGVLYNSIAKGDSRKRLSFMSNESGVAKAEHLEGGSQVAYRVSVMQDGATFAIAPFRMPETGGMRALLHVFPVVSDMASAVVAMQSMVYAEVKDDRVQVQQAFKIYNLGKNAWVPKDLVVKLPEEFTAFTSQQGMSDVVAEAVPKTGARIRGTFGPGEHLVEFRWQLPYAGEADVRFAVELPPRTVTCRVLAPASKGISLDVPGFSAAQPISDGGGQSVLMTEKQVRHDEAALGRIEVTIGGLPTEGYAKHVVVVLSLAAMAFGIVLASRARRETSQVKTRARILELLEELERAHREGIVGPKTYEKGRRDLIDELARAL